MLVRHERPIRCLLMGYNGTGNTGSDIRLLTAIDDVRAAFGEETSITIVSIDCERTESVIPSDERIQVVPFKLAPHKFIPSSYRLAWQHDVTILIEGSTFKQSWSPWLLHAYIWSAQHALWCGNYAVAYAVDVGDLTAFHALCTRWIVNKMSLVMTRTEIARKRLEDMGVKRPIIANTDTAFQYRGHVDSSPGPPAVGIAPVEFFHWPVQFKLWDRSENRYRWPFSFRWTPERRQRSQDMVENYVQLVRHIQNRHDLDVKLIAMEDVDAEVCERIYDALTPDLRERTSVVTSRQTGPEGMVTILRSLHALVTSRYHACVLSMETAVPQMAIGHDERLESIYSEMGLSDSLLDYQETQLGEKMIRNLDTLLENRQARSELIRNMLETRFRPLCMKNRDDLKAWGESVFEFRDVTQKLEGSNLADQQTKSAANAAPRVAVTKK